MFLDQVFWVVDFGNMIANASWRVNILILCLLIILTNQEFWTSILVMWILVMYTSQRSLKQSLLHIQNQTLYQIISRLSSPSWPWNFWAIAGYSCWVAIMTWRRFTGYRSYRAHNSDLSRSCNRTSYNITVFAKCEVSIVCEIISCQWLQIFLSQQVYLEKSTLLWCKEQ